MSYETIVRNGTVVTPQGATRADLAVAGGRIAAIGQDLARAPSASIIDASGLLVIPGGIDPHVHLNMPAGAVTSSDDWHTGTIAAASGGTTTIIDFVEAESGNLAEALAARRAEAEGQAVIDYGLHMTVSDASAATLAQIPALLAGGCVSFKTYLTYEGFKLSDADFLSALEAIGRAGGTALVHAENDAIVTHLRARFAAEGHVEPRWHARSRPEVAEGEAIRRAIALAEVAGCPLYVVHVSTKGGAEAVARARSQGQRVHGETCPQYLLLTEAEYERPGFESAKFICSPPLRSEANRADLWHRLADGELSAVGTDHCPFFYEGQKDLGRPGGAYPPFQKIPGGLPGIQSRLALLYTFGVATGRLSLERWIDVCCAAPAAIFGLAGRKGALVKGAHADLVLFDPALEVTLSRSVLRENCDYTPYEGFRLKGYPVVTMLRGRVIAREGEFVGDCSGQYLERQGAGEWLR